MIRILFLSFVLSLPCLAQGDSLIAYYAFNGSANDSMQNYHGTESPTDVSYTTGINGVQYSALLLDDGQGGNINLGNPSAFDFNSFGQFSISVWVKQGTSSSYRGVIVRSKNYSIWDYGILVNNGKPYTGRSHKDSYATTFINDGKWHLLTLTYNNSVMKLYVDGIVENTSFVTITDDDGDLVIGAKGNTGANYYNGVIDEVKIFNKELGQSEINALFEEKKHATNNGEIRSNILLYPNPVQNTLTITSDEKIDLIEIYSSSGLLIRTSSSSRIDLSDLDSGLYNVKIIIGKSYSYNKVVVN